MRSGLELYECGWDHIGASCEATSFTPPRGVDPLVPHVPVSREPLDPRMDQGPGLSGFPFPPPSLRR